MKNFRPHRFPPLAHLASASAPTRGADGTWQSSLSAGFQQGLDEGYRQGHETGLAAGHAEGLAAGRSEGYRRGHDEGRRDTLVSFETLARPIDALRRGLEQLQADCRLAMRREVVELVAKVARQVIRAELALQPVQLLSLVDETLAAMPPARDDIEVFLNPEELQRIRELDPERARRWTLIADARLEQGECRVRAGDHEADAGCRQRLAACMEQVVAQLADAAEQEAEEASVVS